MKKTDVQTYYDHGTTYSAVNVKNYESVYDWIRRFKGNGSHEFSDDTQFWAWLEAGYESDRVQEYCDGPDEWAREACWEMAQEAATEIWPPGARHLPWRHRIDTSYTKAERSVYQLGRSGGWCVVDGLPPVECWDAIDVGKWAKFVKIIRAIADDEYPYQFIWNLHVNVYEPRVLEPRQQAEADDLAASLPVMLNA